MRSPASSLNTIAAIADASATIRISGCPGPGESSRSIRFFDLGNLELIERLHEAVRIERPLIEARFENVHQLALKRAVISRCALLERPGQPVGHTFD